MLDDASAILEEAALAPDQLPEALARAARLLGATELSLVNAGSQTPVYLHSANAGGMHRAYFEEGWHALDTRHHAFVRHGATQGRVVTENLLLAAEHRARSPFHQEFCRRFKIEHCVSWSYESEGEAWGYSLLYDAKAGSPEAARLGLIQQLAPVAIRAGMLATSLRGAHLAGLAEGIDRSGRGAAVLDHRGLCIRITRVAERSFDKAFGVRQGRLWAADPASNAALQALADQVRRPLPAGAPGPVRVSRGPDRSPVILQPVRVAGRNLDAWPGARLVVSLVDPETPMSADLAVLRLAFGFTHAEARIAALIVEGLTPEAIANRQSLRVSTVRQYIKQVMSKAGTRTRAELSVVLYAFRTQGPSGAGA